MRDSGLELGLGWRGEGLEFIGLREVWLLLTLFDEGSSDNICIGQAEEGGCVSDVDWVVTCPLSLLGHIWEKMRLQNHICCN